MSTTATKDTEPRRAAVKLVAKAKARVLLVEDEPLTAEVFARALQRDGCEVTVARDGLQALRCLADGIPSAVVLDMGLPALSGVEIARRLRADGHRLPIVVVSATPRHTVPLTDRQLAPGRWIEKPVKPRDLVRVVREVVADATGR